MGRKCRRSCFLSLSEACGADAIAGIKKLNEDIGSNRPLIFYSISNMFTSQITIIPYQKGSPVYYDVYSSSDGKVILFVTSEGVCGLNFLVEPIEELVALMHKRLNVLPQKSPKKVLPWWKCLQQSNMKVTVLLHGTPFQMKVWETLCSIPQGKTRSYTSIAQQMGKEKGVRAVAQACARNPVACLIPCHRVLGKHGEITGYRWGIEKKRQLLKKEGVKNI